MSHSALGRRATARTGEAGPHRAAAAFGSAIGERETGGGSPCVALCARALPITMLWPIGKTPDLRLRLLPISGGQRPVSEADDDSRRGGGGGASFQLSPKTGIRKGCRLRHLATVATGAFLKCRSRPLGCPARGISQGSTRSWAASGRCCNQTRPLFNPRTSETDAKRA